MAVAYARNPMVLVRVLHSRRVFRSPTLQLTQRALSIRHDISRLAGVHVPFVDGEHESLATMSQLLDLAGVVWITNQRVTEACAIVERRRLRSCWQTLVYVASMGSGSPDVCSRHK